ncbi:MAG: DUF542 domain-containing protein [Phycisphaerales bacterium JB059]
MAREITINTPVGRIATAYPELIPELERRGIDYCCGGSRTLRECADRRGTDAEDIATQLRDFIAPGSGDVDLTDYAAMSMTDLADHIEQTHHVFARESLDRLARLTARCVAAHGEDHPHLIELQGVVAALDEDMRDHFVREERVLFPWLRRLERRSEITSGPPWSVRRPIDCMVHDHDEVGEAFEHIHELTDGLTPPESACPTWRACYELLGALETDTHRHIHTENNILFPAGVGAEKRLGGPAHRRPSTPGAGAASR